MNNTQKKYFDIFISYRRNGGSAVAPLLYRQLESEKFTVFLDTDELGSGEFSEAISQAIQNTRNFIVLLSPGFFQRCFEPINEVDVTYQELTAALERWNLYLKKNHGDSKKALSQFRIIPIFLGESLDNYAQFALSKPDIWQNLKNIVAHNGISLVESKSFKNEFSNLILKLLLKPSTQFVEALVDDSLAQSEDKEIEADALKDLFYSYLSMYDKKDYSNIRDFLSHVIHGKLFDILNSDSELNFQTAFQSFRLTSIKKTLARQVSTIASFGSRQKVIDSLKKWLLGDESIKFEGISNPEEYEDRLSFVMNAFIDSFSELRLRNELNAFLRDSIETSNDFLKGFNPENWKNLSPILLELFDRMTYEEIHRKIIRKVVLTIEQRQKLQLSIWQKIKETYGCKDTEKTGYGGGKASALVYVSEIEKFLNYENPYNTISDRDKREKEELESLPSESLHSPDPFENLENAIKKVTYGKSGQFRRFLKNYLTDADISTKGKSFQTLRSESLKFEKGLILTKLSQTGPGLSEIKFLKNDWVEICNHLLIDSSGRIDVLINRIRTTVFGELAELGIIDAVNELEED